MAGNKYIMKHMLISKRTLCMNVTVSPFYRRPLRHETVAVVLLLYEGR